MTDAVKIALIASIPVCISSVGAVVLSFYIARSAAHQAAKELTHHVSDRMDSLEIQINGRLTQLLDITSRAKRAEGILEGHAEKRSSDK